MKIGVKGDDRVGGYYRRINVLQFNTRMGYNRIGWEPGSASLPRIGPLQLKLFPLLEYSNMFQNQPLDQENFIERTIRLENQAHPAHFDTIKVMFKYKTSNRTLSFDPVLHSLCKQGFPLEGSQIFFWDNVKQLFVYIGSFPSQTPLDIPYQYFQQKLMCLRYRKIPRKMEPLKERERESGTKRVKQRTIQQAFEKVSVWQKLYQKTDLNGKKLYTLEAAAREIGVAKKTLDDYKNQLRLGEKYHFDFAKNQFQKIGVLRAYIKCMSSTKIQPQPIKVQPVMCSVERPRSPVPDDVIKMEAESEPSVNNSNPEDSGCEGDDGYLFHQTHSCCDSD